ncbi:MAG: hypothetical protein ACRCU5_10715 [Rhizobiaceae bacterium]
MMSIASTQGKFAGRQPRPLFTSGVSQCRLQIVESETKMANETGRYIAVSDLEKMQLDDLVSRLERTGIKVEQRFDMFKTLILKGDPETILKLPRTTVGIRSVEPEGTVGVSE